jgi:hypothetical protein
MNERRFRPEDVGSACVKLSFEEDEAPDTAYRAKVLFAVFAIYLVMDHLCSGYLFEISIEH